MARCALTSNSTPTLLYTSSRPRRGTRQVLPVAQGRDGCERASGLLGERRHRFQPRGTLGHVPGDHHDLGLLALQMSERGARRGNVAGKVDVGNLGQPHPIEGAPEPGHRHLVPAHQDPRRLDGERIAAHHGTGCTGRGDKEAPSGVSR